MKDRITVDGVEYVRAPGAPNDSPPGLSYAIVRSRDQGVMAGYIKSIDGRRVTLLRARQLWGWKSSFTLVDAAEKGVMADGCKFSCEASEPVDMLEACGVLRCSSIGEQQIRAVPAQRHE